MTQVDFFFSLSCVCLLCIVCSVALLVRFEWSPATQKIKQSTFLKAYSFFLACFVELVEPIFLFCQRLYLLCSFTSSLYVKMWINYVELDNSTRWHSFFASISNKLNKNVRIFHSLHNVKKKKLTLKCEIELLIRMDFRVFGQCKKKWQNN